jgi:catechol 2,3-dioxygenase-like lactoylglutathione lyase family enzyme
MSESQKLIPSTIKGMHHVGVAVSDIEKSLAFYQSTTSITRLDRDRLSGFLPESPMKSAVLKAPNGHLQIMQFEGDADIAEVPVEGPGVTHLCFQSPAEDALFKKLIEHKATSVSIGEPPIDLAGQGVHYAYARDADNIMYEVEQLDKPPFEGPIWLAHIALATPDLDRSVAFYRNLLGVETYRHANKVTGARFDEVTGIKDVRLRVAWFNTGNMVLEIWQFVTPKTQQPSAPLPFSKIGFNKFALEVGDLEAECQRLRTMGVELLNEPCEENGVTEVYARDPDGNLFSLLEISSDEVPSVADLKQISWLPSPSNPTAGQ